MAVVKVTAASQAHFSSWLCSSYFRSGKQSAAHWPGRAVQSRGGFREKLHARNAKTWSGRCLCCAIFSLGCFQTFNHLFDRLVHLKTRSNRQKRHPCKDSLNLCKLFLQRNCYSVVFIACMYEYQRCTSYIDVYRQKWSDVYLYICVYSVQYTSFFTCDYSQL